MIDLGNKIVKNITSFVILFIITLDFNTVSIALVFMLIGTEML